ncbi:MAG: PAS domain S-box protein [Actinomycetota bacterium]|nr:PAS domain S-box protein [Actinomycetota bacterium]
MEQENRRLGRERDAELRFLRSIVENANDAILVPEGTPIEEPGPRIFYVNETFTRMTGYTLEDVKGRTPRILQGPGTDRAARDEIRAALERWRAVRVELRNYRKDGTEFWVQLNIVPVLDDDGLYTHWVSVQRDVTERKREEEKKRKSEEAFRAALSEQASDIVLIVGADGVVRYGSPSLENTLGYRPEEVVGTHVSAYVHQDDAEEALSAFEEVLGGPGVGNKPSGLRVRHKDGSWRHFEAVGTNMIDDPSVGGVVVNAWEVTGHKRVEDELKLRDRAIAASSNGIIISDPNRPDNPIIT